MLHDCESVQKYPQLLDTTIEPRVLPSKLFHIRQWVILSSIVL